MHRPRRFRPTAQCSRALVAAVTLVAVAVPTVAAQGGDEPEQRENVIELSDELMRHPPGASDRGREQFLEAVKAEELAEARRKAQLASPEARAEREASRTAYEDSTDSGGLELFRKNFGEQVADASVDATDLADGGRIVGFLDDFTMRVDHGGERGRELVLSPAALRSRDEDSGKTEPTDLALEAEGGVLEPDNAPADLELPGALEQGAKVGQVQVYPEASAAGPSQAKTLSESARFYPEAVTDTDTSLAVTAEGVESFDQLRSRLSPETRRFRLALPEGAELRLDPKTGGAAVVKGSERLMSITAPVAVDAAGSEVPASLSLEGDTVEVITRHRDGDFQYPISSDPTFVDDTLGPGPSYNQSWWSGNAAAVGRLNDWVYQVTNASTTDPTRPFVGSNVCAFSPCYAATPYGGQYRGLYLYAYPNRALPAWGQAQYVYDPPGTHTQVASVLWGHMYFTLGHTAAVPRLYAGIWNATYQRWITNYPNPYINGSAGFSNSTLAQNSGSPPDPGGHLLAVGLQNTSTATTMPNAWRTAYIGGATITLRDDIPPKIDSAANDGPSGWLKAGAPPFTVSASATDYGTAAGDAGTSGLGMGAYSLWVPKQGGGFSIQTRTRSCSARPSDPCAPTLALPSGSLGAFTYSADDSDPNAANDQPMPEGINTVGLDARDATGGSSTARNWQVKVDRSGPLVTSLSGPLYEQRAQLSPGPNTLTINATDGVQNGADADRRSGVKRVKVKVDGVEEWASPDQTSCSSPDSCPLNAAIYTFETADFSPGDHEIEVLGEDQVGNVTAAPQKFTVTAPPSGELVAPNDGQRTARRLSLKAKADAAALSGVKFQYRRAGTWTDIPVSTLSRSDGQPVGQATQPLSAGESPKLTWDVPPTFMAEPKDGDLQVRGVFSGGNGGVTKPRAAVLDRRGLSADNAREQIGPGQVDLLTGNFAYSADDVSIDSFAQSLSTSRTFNSRDPQAGPDGPFGAGWSSAIPVDDGVADYASLTEKSDLELGTYAELKGSDGTVTTFSLEGGAWKPEDGAEDLTLASVGSTRELKDIDGNKTVFEKPYGSEAFVPTQISQPGSDNKTRFEFEPVPGMVGKVRVKRAIAPSAVDCTNGLVRGCRALEFEYAAAATPAPGDDSGQWGAYAGRLAKVTFTAYDSESNQMKTEEVESYAYDSQGRLRAAWDPRISPTLKETYAYDPGGRLSEIKPPGEEAWRVYYQPLGDDQDGGRLQAVTRNDPANGLATRTLGYEVPLSGAGAPYAMGAGDVAAWGQDDRPVTATAIYPPDRPPTSYAGVPITYLNAEGRAVNAAAPGGHITTTEYDDKGNVVRELSAANRERALGIGGGTATTAARAATLDTRRTYSDDGLEVRDEVGPIHEVKLASGEVVQARKHTTITYDDGNTATPKPHLPTTTSVAAQISGRPDADVRVTTTEYDWALRKPTATITEMSAGEQSIVRRTSYDPATGLETSSQMPKSNGSDAGTTKTVYYSAAANQNYPECGSKAEWSNLACKTLPAAQPTGGLPAIPTTTLTYNRFNQVTMTKEDTASGAQRTTTTTYDAAGRKTIESVASNQGEPVPAVTTTYSETTGKPTTVSQYEGALLRTLTTEYDGLGRITAYTDGDGNRSTTGYDILSRPTTTNDGKGTQTRTYNPDSGLLTQLEDSDAGTFTASYDADGKLTSKTYPNGMRADTTYDETASPVALRYTKTTNCSSNCTWLEESVKESVHGQWVDRQSSLSDQKYTYDKAGRLTEVKDTPAGQGCTVRAYTFDLNSNRTQKTTRSPAMGGACADSGGVTQNYSYDEADRLTGSGITYDGFGRMGEIPAEHSGGGPLSYSYYSNDQVRTISQDGSSKTYALDPAGRQRSTIAGGGTTATETLHYSDDSDSPSWTSVSENGSEASWTRNVEGIDGDLAAVKDSQSGTKLELQNLHGDVVATASTDPAAPALLEKFESDEFGNPRVQQAGRRYGWLGGKQRRTELKSGAVQMGMRSYVPAMGRFTSTDPVAGGSATDYDYGGADPVNNFDLSGQAYGTRRTAAEVRFCIRPWNYSRCRRASRLADRAAATTARIYGRRASVPDGRADAFRHCYWSALMTFQLGASFARQIGNRHEDFSGNRDRRMDLRNNFLGRRVALNRRSLPGARRAGSAASTCVRNARPGGQLIVTNR